MVDGNAPKIRRVLCPRCRCVLVENPEIPVYKCGKCDAVLQAKHCRSGAKLHNKAGGNENASPGGLGSTFIVSDTPVGSPQNVSASSNGKTLLEVQHYSPMENVAEVNNLKGEIPHNGCNVASSVIDNLEAKIPCLNSSNGCKPTLDVVNNLTNQVPNADAGTGSLDGDTVMTKAQAVDVSADLSPKDEVPILDGCSSSNSRQLSPEREINSPKRNGEHVSLDDLCTRNENISEMDNVKDEAPPTNDGCFSCNSEHLSPKANGKTENDEVKAEHTVLCKMEADTVMIKAQTVDVSIDLEIETPKDEVPILDGCSSSNSRQLSPERGTDSPKMNGEHVSLDDLCTGNENFSEMDNVKDESPPSNSGGFSCNSEHLSPKANGKTENFEVRSKHTVLCNMEGDAVTIKAQTVDVSTDLSEIESPKDEVPILDGCSSSNSRQLSPEREIDSPKRNGDVSLDDLCTVNENISEMDNVKDEAPPTNSGCSSCTSEQLSPKAHGKTENDEVKAEHTLLCNMLEESLSIGRDSSLPVTSPEKNEDHLESADPNSREADIDDRQIGNRHGNPARKPPRIVHHAYDASVSSFEDGYNNRFASGYHLTSKRTFRSQRSSELSRSRELNETNNSFVYVEPKKVSKTRLQENALPPRLLKPRYSSETVESFMPDREELPTRFGGDNGSERKASVGSEDFYSVQNWTETEDSSSLRNLSRGSQFSTTGPDRIELLRKIDELRGKLMGSHDTWDERPHFNGNKQIGDWQSTSGGSASEQEIYRIPSVQSHLLDPHRSRKSMIEGHQRKLLPPTIHPDATCFCLHCTPGRHLQANAGVPAAAYCSNELCGLYCHICSQPGNLKCHLHSDLRCQPRKYSHNFEKLQHKRDHSRKRHYRPILGGANLLTCYECLKVLQIPEDFHFSRKRCNKLRCGACSKVLSLALVSKNQIVPYILALQLQLPTGRGNTTSNYVSTPNGFHVPPRNHHFRQWGREQVSYSDEYGPSFERSCEIEDEHVQYVSRDSTDSMIDRGINKPPLHSLMGYISASEIIYNL